MLSQLLNTTYIERLINSLTNQYNYKQQCQGPFWLLLTSDTFYTFIWTSFCTFHFKLKKKKHNNLQPGSPCSRCRTPLRPQVSPVCSSSHPPDEPQQEDPVHSTLSILKGEQLLLQPTPTVRHKPARPLLPSAPSCLTQPRAMTPDLGRKQRNNCTSATLVDTQ